jgi:ParB family chromosome partitioning protein
MQRGFNELSVSEQAKVLQYHNSKMFSQGKRNDILEELERLEHSSTSSQIETKLKRDTSLDKLGDNYGMSRPTVARLIRVNHLIQPFKSLIDEKSIPLMVGVELSYLTEDAQSMVYETITKHKKKLNIKLAKTIRETFSQNGDVTTTTLEGLIVKKDTTTDSKYIKVPLDKTVYSKYFDKSISNEELAEVLKEALEGYFKV